MLAMPTALQNKSIAHSNIFILQITSAPPKFKMHQLTSFQIIIQLAYVHKNFRNAFPHTTKLIRYMGNVRSFPKLKCHVR